MADKSMDINLNGEKFTLTRYNTTLYTFWGRVILRDYELQADNFDHVFMRLSEETAEKEYGAFLFKDNPLFAKISQFILENHFPVVANDTHIPESDVNAWESTMFHDLSAANEVPKDWI